MKYRIFLVLITFTLSLSAKEKVYVACFSSIGIKAYSGISATVVLADRINSYGAYEAILPQQVDSLTHVETVSEARESAEVLSTSYYIVGRIVKIEKVYHVSMDLYAMSSGMSVWSYSETTPYASDIPVIMDRIASKLGTSKKWSRKGDVNRTTKGEAKRLIRHKAARGIGAFVGGLVPISDRTNLNETTYYLAPGFGFVLSNDLGNFILQLNYSRYSLTRNPYFTGASSYQREDRYNSFGLDVLHPLFSTNNTPYASLGAAYQMQLTSLTTKNLIYSSPDLFSETRRNSFIVNGGLGYVLRRNANSSLYISGKGYLLLTNNLQADYGALLNIALVLGRK